MRLFVALFFLFSASNVFAFIHVVAAENIYGNVIQQLGGDAVNVLSIINHPNQDPHLFNVSPSQVKAITDANLIVYNGAGYDAWIKPFVPSNKSVIVVADLVNVKAEENPHIWYQPDTILIFAKKILFTLNEMDPANKKKFEEQFKKFQMQYQIIFVTIKQLRDKFHGTTVIATEPIFEYMAKSIGLNMVGEDFQKNMMNDLPPTISQIKDFENHLRNHTVSVLIYNNQVVNPMTERMLTIARQENIPVLGVSETLPNNMDYIPWMLNQLQQLETALQNRARS